MRVRLRWKLLLWISVPAAAVSLLVVSLLLSDSTPEELARLTANARLGPLWSVFSPGCYWEWGLPGTTCFAGHAGRQSAWSREFCGQGRIEHGQ